MHNKKQIFNPYLPSYEYIPDVAQGKDGRYYLYYSVAHSSVMSVAVFD